MYNYTSPAHGHHHEYLIPPILQILGEPKTILEVGCGNGSTASTLSKQGHTIIGIDPSESGIEQAQKAFPQCRFEVGSTDELLTARFGTFDIVLSLEVVEHVFLPRRFARCIADLLNPGGVAIISTPYHGYWKNLAHALVGWNPDPLWDRGHIKFWTRSKLQILFAEVGLREVQFLRVGRVPQLAKSMVCVFRKIS